MCADGRQIAVGAIEPQFWAQLLTTLGIACDRPSDLQREAAWPETTRLLEAAFASQPCAHWTALFRGTDACVYPVLTTQEALSDPHLQARGTFVDQHGIPHTAPAPRFSRTPGAIQDGRTADPTKTPWSTA